MRSTRRASGSGVVARGEGNEADAVLLEAAPLDRAYDVEADGADEADQEDDQNWCHSAVWKLETISELPVCSVRPMPGIDY